MKEETKKMVQKNPLYKKMEDEYDTKVLMPGLEEKKKTLATIRSLHSPIDTEGLQEYSKKMSAIVEEKKQ